MTIEDLAIMVKRGFDHTATKEDLKNLATKEELHLEIQGIRTEMRDGFHHVNARLDTLHHDIDDLPEIREEVHDLRKRVDKLERKVSVK